jgi:hypothetical protein
MNHFILVIEFFIQLSSARGYRHKVSGTPGRWGMGQNLRFYEGRGLSRNFVHLSSKTRSCVALWWISAMMRCMKQLSMLHILKHVFAENKNRHLKLVK